MREYSEGLFPCVNCASYDLSLVSLSLEIGRTYQIRVHMRTIVHPLPGDGLYILIIHNTQKKMKNMEIFILTQQHIWDIL